MKRFLIILLIMLMICSAGCGRGNRREIGTEQRMNRAVIKLGNELIEVEVEAYYRDSDKVRIWTTDRKLYITSSTNVVLICDEVE